MRGNLAGEHLGVLRHIALKRPKNAKSVPGTQALGADRNDRCLAELLIGCPNRSRKQGARISATMTQGIGDYPASRPPMTSRASQQPRLAEATIGV